MPQRKGRDREAADAYEKAETLIRSTGSRASLLDPSARLAELALAHGNVTEARRLIRPVLAADKAALEAAEDALAVEFIIYRVLRACSDAHADDWLRAARARLLERANHLPQGVTRDRFLSKFALHREVLAATPQAG